MTVIRTAFTSRVVDLRIPAFEDGLDALPSEFVWTAP